MSRLYGRSVDVYSISKYLIEGKLPKYKNDNRKTTWEELSYCPEIIEFYLPDNAIKIIEKNPIRIVHSPLVVKKAYMMPRNSSEEATMYLPRNSPIEEYKRELVFFLGENLSNVSPDFKPTEYSIPCEYTNILGLLLEYLYLKEKGLEDRFSSKHFNELLYNSKKYVKSYLSFQDAMLSSKASDLSIINESEKEKRDQKMKEMQKQFLEATLTCLTPLSSFDGVLQLIDNGIDENQIKKIIEVLVENKNHDRQSIINGMGIDSYGYKRLRKEIDRRR